MKTQSALALLLVFLSTNCAAGVCLKYDDKTVSVRGKVIVRTFFGPPGYGEDPKTDSRERQALLKLDHPICVDASSNEEFEVAETNQKEITLVPAGSFSMSSYIGKRVTVKGSLFHAETGHHHTMILIQLEQPPSMSP
jgi:hypothetical protein